MVSALNFSYTNGADDDDDDHYYYYYLLILLHTLYVIYLDKELLDELDVRRFAVSKVGLAATSITAFADIIIIASFQVLTTTWRDNQNLLLIWRFLINYSETGTQELAPPLPVNPFD